MDTTTTTQPNISSAHEMTEILISKYDATENQVSTGKPQVSKLSKLSSARSKISIAHEEVGIKVLKSCESSHESSQTGSKILITHENLTHFHMPKVIKNIDRDKPRTDRATTSMGTNKGIIKYDTTAITKYDTISTRPNFSVAHEEASTAIPEFPTTQSNISFAHASKYTGNNDKYAATGSKSLEFSTRSNFSVAHDKVDHDKPHIDRVTTSMETNKGIIKVKYTTTEKSSWNDKLGSKFFNTHENLTHFHMPQVINQDTDRGKPRTDRVTASMGMDKGIIKVKYATTATTKYEATSTRPNISVAHEEASTATPKVLTSSELSSARPNTSIAHEEARSTTIPQVLKSLEFSSTRPYISVTHEEASTAISNDVLKLPELSSARSKISNAHESKYTGMNTKYAITATKQSSYVPNPISNDNPINNNKSFCSQYLQTVLKITDNNNNNNNNNKHDTFNNIQLSLLWYAFIPIHPFIEYLQPEPEPPPLNSYFNFFSIFFHWT
jgi:hypothetical protein